jgi:hypothetical protein
MQSACFEIKNCEVCESKDLEIVLSLGDHPLCDDLVSFGEERQCVEYPIKIAFCNNCKTAHQTYQVNKIDLFPQSYHYRSRHTNDVINGMQDLVNSVEKIIGPLKDMNIVDIGCNDGSLLDIFRSKGSKTLGVEPTSAALDAIHKKHNIFHEYFDEGVSKRIIEEYKFVNVITFTNVFAHIENLHSMLQALQHLIGSDTLLVIENHYLGKILEFNQFDTFYHEHPRTYSLSSFIHIANTLNLKIRFVEFPSRYGGNIRIIMSRGTPKKANIESVLQVENGFKRQFEYMNRKIEKWLISKKTEIMAAVNTHGKIIAKAFPGRAAIPMKLLGLNENQILAVFEKPGSAKIGHYLPGTRIPILSDNEMHNYLKPNMPILNLAWHIETEIRDYLTGIGFSGNIINIIDKNDF